MKLQIVNLSFLKAQDERTGSYSNYSTTWYKMVMAQSGIPYAFFLSLSLFPHAPWQRSCLSKACGSAYACLAGRSQKAAANTNCCNRPGMKQPWPGELLWDLCWLLFAPCWQSFYFRMLPWARCMPASLQTWRRSSRDGLGQPCQPLSGVKSL